jgi:hypothetical protein
MKCCLESLSVCPTKMYGGEMNNRNQDENGIAFLWFWLRC